MVLATVMAALWLVLAHSPDIPSGRALHRWLVLAPAARLARITAGQVLLTVLIVTAVVLGVWVLGEETARLIGLATPEVASWIAMFEVTTYLDAAVAILSASTALRLGRWSAPIRSAIGRTGARRPGPRSRSRVTRPAPANDDEDPAAPLAA